MMNKEQVAEARKNAVGRKLLMFSIIGFAVFTVIAFATNADLAWLLLLVCAVGIALGIVLCMWFRSEQSIRKDNLEAQKKAAAFVSHVVNNQFDTSSLYEKPEKKSDGTKEIVKGAVIGGIVAGEAGAVVGAIVAKNKLDKEAAEQAEKS